MEIQKFLSKTQCLSALLWTYSKEHLRVLRKKNTEQLLEFKMLSACYYLSKLEHLDYELFKSEANKIVNSLVLSVNDATYGEPMNAFSGFHMGKEYFIEKLDLYLQDIKKVKEDNSHFPKFIYHSIISMPLKNTDDFFFGSFDTIDYPEDFKTNLNKVLSLFEYFLDNPDLYIKQLNLVKNNIQLSVLDPNRNRQISEELLTLI